MDDETGDVDEIVSIDLWGHQWVDAKLSPDDGGNPIGEERSWAPDNQLHIRLVNTESDCDWPTTKEVDIYFTSKSWWVRRVDSAGRRWEATTNGR